MYLHKQNEEFHTSSEFYHLRTYIKKMGQVTHQIILVLLYHNTIKVIIQLLLIQGVTGGMCETSGECSLC